MARRPQAKFYLLSFFTFFVIITFLQSGCERRFDIANKGAKAETIVCFGDSITQGFGVKPEESFPSLLGEQLGQPVINAGVSGDTTAGALRRLERDVLSKKPKLVIVEFGGNDFLQRVPQDETFANLDKIVTEIQDHGAMVVLATVKIGLLTDQYCRGFKRIAKKRKALLIPDIMRGIFDDPHLKYDGLHPNAEGHKIIAERIYQLIYPLLE